MNRVSHHTTSNDRSRKRGSTQQKCRRGAKKAIKFFRATTTGIFSLNYGMVLLPCPLGTTPDMSKSRPRGHANDWYGFRGKTSHADEAGLTPAPACASLYARPGLWSGHRRKVAVSQESDDILDELDLTPRRGFVGAAPRKFLCEYVRDLSLADVEALSVPGRAAPARQVQRLRASHHSLARCLATGMQPYQAALVTGYNAARISVLQADPSFKQLVADYREETKQWCADFGTRMNDLGLDFLELLQERLEDEPEKFSTSTILDAIKIFADRTGHGPGVDLKVTAVDSTIDRPPREDYDAWTKRRQRELSAESLELEPPTRTTN